MFFSSSPSRALEARLEALASPAALTLLEGYHAHLDERGIEHRDLPAAGEPHSSGSVSLGIMDDTAHAEPGAVRPRRSAP